VCFLTSLFLRKRSLLRSGFVCYVCAILLKLLVLKSCSVMFSPVQSCSVLFSPAQSCLFLFSHIQSCSFQTQPFKTFLSVLFVTEPATMSSRQAPNEKPRPIPYILMKMQSIVFVLQCNGYCTDQLIIQPLWMSKGPDNLVNLCYWLCLVQTFTFRVQVLSVIFFPLYFNYPFDIVSAGRIYKSYHFCSSWLPQYWQNYSWIKEHS
jgi:hypothetical protein